MYALTEFNNACAELDLNDGERFTHFRTTLGGTARGAWQVASQGQPQTNVGFTQAIAALLLTLFTRDSFSALCRYFELLRKPRKMTAQELMIHLRTLASYESMLPNAQENRLNNDALKDLYLRMMPDYPQTQFHANKNINEMTLAEMAAYFTVLEQDPMNDPRKSRMPKGREDDGLQKSKRSNGRDGSNDNRYNPQKCPKGKVNDDDDCPYHKYRV